MPTSRQGSVHLFRFRGIDVFLHWSWFLFAIFEINMRSGRYSSIIWNVVEYLSLFLIVLLHEFGHALACRQVGGRANNIVLWPLGGVAYVDPPPRPGAVLWSLAAGPLVNVALVPVILLLTKVLRFGLGLASPDLFALLEAIFYINAALLVFNMLPIYPLDGGQILRALLWFLMGRARSLMTATVSRLHRCGRIDRGGRADRLALVRRAFGLYFAELLGWHEASRNVTARRENAAPSWILLSLVQGFSAGG